LTRRNCLPASTIPAAHDTTCSGPRSNAWHNAFNRLQRCYERRETVINAFVDLADAIITVRSLIRKSWITHRWDTRPIKSP
jgi:hypothetical protein